MFWFINFIIVRLLSFANDFIFLYLIVSKLQFSLEGIKNNARAWVILLNGISIKTPIFMPVWTKATIKWIFLEMLQNPQYLWELEPLMIMLSNTFHLTLRPGEGIIKNAWGIQKFMNWPWLVLTDSWWFQVFSLWLGKDKSNITKKWPIISLKEDWIKFRSPIDGSQHYMTPEDCINIQCDLWSDIMMMLDVCSPWWSDKKTYTKHMQMTHRRADRQFLHFQKKYDTSRGVLFPIVQWGTDLWLRQESIDLLSPDAIDGIAVGGVSVGESRNKIEEIISFCGEKLPSTVPRYLMGIGDESTITYAIESWFDMFDCVMPTRLGRHGIAYTVEGNIHLSNSKFRSDHSPLCFSLKNNLSKIYTKSYIHHLLREREMLWWLLLSLHNILYLHEVVSDLRDNIIKWS